MIGITGNTAGAFADLDCRALCRDGVLREEGVRGGARVRAADRKNAAGKALSPPHSFFRRIFCRLSAGGGKAAGAAPNQSRVKRIG